MENKNVARDAQISEIIKIRKKNISAEYKI